MFSRSWIRCFICTAFLYTSITHQVTHKKCIHNCVFTLEGNTYNISSLSSSRLEAQGKLYPGYWYSFNPCASFTLGDCKSDVAVCRAHPQTGFYQNIGTQSSVECGFYEKSTIPKLQYSAKIENLLVWRPAVLLKCDPNEKDGKLKVWIDNGATQTVLNLTHKCACPNACLVKPLKPTTAAPSSPFNDIVIEVVPSAAGGVALIFVLIVIWRRYRRRRRNDEYPPLLVPGDGVVDETVNRFPDQGSELTSERSSASLTKRSSTGSPCSDITVPNKDKTDNLNSKIKKNAEDHC